MTNNVELLSGLSDGELEALAESKLAPANQLRMDDLLRRLKAAQLSPHERSELDHFLAQIDQLNVLKARARYTLAQKSAATM